MGSINVVVNGVYGKMGQEVVRTISRESGIAMTGATSRSTQSDFYRLPDGLGNVPLSTSLKKVIEGADVVVDFTSSEGAMAAIRVAAKHKVNVVTGSTGLVQSDCEEADDLSRENQIGIIVAPNFALGAVLMIHLAKLLGRFFDYAAVGEAHHEEKRDAPSGTALAIASAAVDGRNGGFTMTHTEKVTLPGTRGGLQDGVSIHSTRMPGRVAHHELVFGTQGQTLTIRHDSINRESFMPGVTMAIREVVKTPRLTVGLEKILNL